MGSQSFQMRDIELLQEAEAELLGGFVHRVVLLDDLLERGQFAFGVDAADSVGLQRGGGKANERGAWANAFQAHRLAVLIFQPAGGGGDLARLQAQGSLADGGNEQSEEVIAGFYLRLAEV